MSIHCCIVVATPVWNSHPFARYPSPQVDSVGGHELLEPLLTVPPDPGIVTDAYLTSAIHTSIVDVVRLPTIGAMSAFKVKFCRSTLHIVSKSADPES
jgi:hypothetical protein